MKTIIWDVDDVLNNLMEGWLSSAWKPAHSDCGLSYSELTENPPYRLLGVSAQDYYASLDAYRPVADKEMEPRWTILDWLWKEGRDYRHVALTARPLHDTASCAEWIMRHLGDYVRTFAVVPRRTSRETPQYDRTKVDYLRWLGHYTVLVDDDLDTVGAARRAGLRAVLFPQPWNRSKDTVDQALAKILALMER